MAIEVASLLIFYNDKKNVLMQLSGVRGHWLSLIGTFSTQVLSLLIAHGTNSVYM